jgi:MFS family permease
MLGARGILGIASGMGNITAILYLMRSGPAGQRSRRANLYELAVVAGMAVSSDLGGVVGGRWGWRWSFGLGVLVLIAAWAVAARRVLPALMAIELPPTSRGVSVRTGRRLPSGPILAIYLAMFTQAFAWGGGISTLLPLYGGRALDLSPSAIGRTMALAFWVEVCLLFPVGWAADAWGKTRILLPAFLAILLGTLLVPATGGILGYGAAFVLLTAGMSGWMLVPAILTEHLGGDFRGRSAAFYRLVTDLGFILAPATVGWLIGRSGFHAAAWAIGIVVASSLLLSFRFLSRPGEG